MNIIEIENLTKYYGKSRGIADVSFAVPEGGIFGFIGPNGAGKSTTIRTLLAFIFPNAGKARIFGLDCFRESERIKRETGYLPSEVNYYYDMKVKDLLSYSARFYKKDCKSRIDELCDKFEVEREKRIDSLSMGNKKKVAIVQAMLHDPRLLILDEPTSGLDPLMQNKFFEVLGGLNRKGTTIFFSSHVLSEVQRMCDKVAIIKEGRILRVEQVDKLRDERYRKIRLEFRQDEPRKDLDGLEGVSSLSKDKDGHLEFFYKGDIGSFIKELSVRRVENLFIEEPSLEEIFMHYYVKEAD